MQPEQRQLVLHNKNVFISCVVPVFNEEAVIEPFITQLQTTLGALTTRYEIIVVDDGSRDETIAKVRLFTKNCHVKLLGLSRNFGKEVALTAGLEHASGDVVVLLDADFQHPLEMLPAFLTHWANGYDMVYGVRSSRESESAIKRNFAQFFYWLMQKITKIDMPSNAGDFRLMDRQSYYCVKTIS